MGGIVDLFRDDPTGPTIPDIDTPTIESDLGDIDITDSTIGQDEPITLGTPDTIDIPDLTITSAIGGKLDNTGTLFTPEEEESRLKSISKKRLGTRGLQIPLVADTSTTVDTTPAEGGIQI